LHRSYGVWICRCVFTNTSLAIAWNVVDLSDGAGKNAVDVDVPPGRKAKYLILAQSDKARVGPESLLW